MMTLDILSCLVLDFKVLSLISFNCEMNALKTAASSDKEMEILVNVNILDNDAMNYFNFMMYVHFMYNSSCIIIIS